MKNLFKWLLVIGMIVTTLVFSKAEAEKEPKAESSQGSENINFYPAPFIISFNIAPNPAEWGQTVIPRYRVEPINDPQSYIDYYINGQKHDLVSLMKILNNDDYDGGYGCIVTLNATNYAGTARKDVTFYRKPKDDR